MTSPEGSKRRKRVIVGVDGSDESIAALRWAVRLAPALDADVEAVTVWNYPPFYGLAPAVDSARRPAHARARKCRSTG
jgi:nucleotide-binding universal stress UspA family protein